MSPEVRTIRRHLRERHRIDPSQVGAQQHRHRDEVIVTIHVPGIEPADVEAAVREVVECPVRVELGVAARVQKFGEWLARTT